MDLQDAVDNFRRAITHCDNLVAVHRGYGTGSVGRRTEEVSLDRAVVVVAVAAWQAAVQDLTSATLDIAAPPALPSLARATYEVSAGYVRKGIRDFATPNSHNCRQLIQGAGFDPWTTWTWSNAGGRGVGMVEVRPHEAAERLDHWLRVRHAIAHGHAELPRVRVLQSVREAAPSWAGVPTLRLVDAEQCMSFVRRMVRLTANGLATHLGVAATT